MELLQSWTKPLILPHPYSMGANLQCDGTVMTKFVSGIYIDELVQYCSIV